MDERPESIHQRVTLSAAAPPSRSPSGCGARFFSTATTAQAITSPAPHTLCHGGDSSKKYLCPREHFLRDHQSQRATEPRNAFVAGYTPQISAKTISVYCIVAAAQQTLSF